MDRRQQAELVSLMERYAGGEGLNQTPIGGVQVFRAVTPQAPLPTVYTPSLCLVVQGRKSVMVGKVIHRYAAGHYLAVSVDLPVIGHVIEASAAKPYLSLQIAIDPQTVSELMAQMPAADPGHPMRGLFVGRADEALADCFVRLMRLNASAGDIAVLAPLVLREIHYRLLCGPNGAAIARRAVKGSVMQRLARAIGTLKRDFAEPINMEALAAAVHMSPSAFYQHFRDVTAMSPLQYQKRLRLLEARRLMLTRAAGAAEAAYRVGYESSSQFSREYSRLFGAPPTTDIERLLAA